MPGKEDMEILDTLEIEQKMLSYFSQFDQFKGNHFNDLLQKYDGSEECKNDDMSIKAREDGNRHYQKKNLSVRSTMQKGIKIIKRSKSASLFSLAVNSTVNSEKNSPASPISTPPVCISLH